MTIRRKLILSNMLMTASPLLLVIGAALIFSAYGRDYIEPVVNMYRSEQGVYSAQSLIYACKEELSTREWEHYDWYEDNDLVMAEQPSKKLRMFEQNLHDMGYHFEIAIHDKVVYSNFTDADRRFASLRLNGALRGLQSLSMTADGGAMVRNTFGPEDEPGTVTAVYLPGRGRAGERSYIEKYVITVAAVLLLLLIAAITVTDYALSGAVARMFLRPLADLRSGLRRVADGNLDVTVDCCRDDEFGEVCREFDQMRLRLKDSVNEKRRHENYRRMMISGISHDLRTPLTSIRGYAEGLRDGVASTPEMRHRYCRAILRSASDMSLLADSLSLLARLENRQYSYRLETTELNGWLKDLTEEQAPSFVGRAMLDCRCSAEKLHVDVDRGELRRVFVNLFENSVKYAHRRPVKIEVALEETDGLARICVADNGKGAAEDDLPHLFEPFYRGDKARSRYGDGSGLGLAVVRQIVEGCGGTVGAFNDGGFCVEMKFPLCREVREGTRGGKNTDR